MRYCASRYWRSGSAISDSPSTRTPKRTPRPVTLIKALVQERVIACLQSSRYIVATYNIYYTFSFVKKYFRGGRDHLWLGDGVGRAGNVGRRGGRIVGWGERRGCGSGYPEPRRACDRGLGALSD